MFSLIESFDKVGYTERQLTPSYVSIYSAIGAN